MAQGAERRELGPRIEELLSIRLLASSRLHACSALAVSSSVTSVHEAALQGCPDYRAFSPCHSASAGVSLQGRNTALSVRPASASRAPSSNRASGNLCVTSCSAGSRPEAISSSAFTLWRGAKVVTPMRCRAS